MDKDRKQKEEIFLQAIREGKNQKEASVLAGWHESTGSRYLKKVRETKTIEDAQKAYTVNLEEKQAIAQETEKDSLEGLTGTQGDTLGTGKEEKPDKKFLKFNMTEYEDYLKAMAWYNKTSVTGYIQGLIIADMEKNGEKYRKLKEI